MAAKAASVAQLNSPSGRVPNQKRPENISHFVSQLTQNGASQVLRKPNTRTSLVTMIRSRALSILPPKISGTKEARKIT